MEVGLFLEFPRQIGTSESEAFEYSLELVELAEQLGIDSIWLAELPFEPAQSVLSSPLIVGTAAASRTKRIRIGLAVAVLPLYDPIRLAQEVATMDHISGGRVEFGIGRSASPGGYIGYNIPYNESRERFFEVLEILKLAWTQNAFSYKGRFYEYNNVSISPRPLQLPHPPIRLATNSPNTYLAAAKLGLPIFISMRGVRKDLEKRTQMYKEEWNNFQSFTHPHISLRVPIYVAESMKIALSDPEKSAMNFYDQLRKTVGSPLAGLSEDENRERLERGKRFEAISYSDVLRTDLAFGTPDVVARKLLELKETFGLSCIIAEPNFGRLLSREKIAKSVKLFAKEVIPLIT